MRTRPNAYSATWHAVFGATQPAESTAHEVAFLARVLPLPEHRSVLDVCCGSGRHLAALSALGYQVTGVERDPAVALAARESAPAARIVEGDANRLADLVDGRFGGVVCLWQSFGYGTTSENVALLGAMAALLEPGGRLVLDVYNRTFFETRTGTRTIERDGRSILEHTELHGDRHTTRLDYGSGVEDVFSWQLFTPEELTKLAGSVGLLPFLACTDFDETISPSAEHARMQLVFERD
jgi:SAM-dependent methyltransferase